MTSLSGFGQTAEGFDLIGDIHGCGNTLANLLEKLDYKRDGTRFYHPSRKVIFVGDIIDRGPRIRKSLSIVKSMVDEGEAICLIGNHEFNAVAHSMYAEHEMADPRFKRKEDKSPKRLPQETTKQFAEHKEEWQTYLEWFKTLPIFFEHDDFRVVHACWDESCVAAIRELNEDNIHPTLNDLLPELVNGNRKVGLSLDRLTRGTSLQYPDGRYLLSRDGIKRSVFRTKFWAESPLTYQDVVFQPDPLPKDLCDRHLDATEKAKLVYYNESQRPLFFGHYWLDDEPSVQMQNLACLDYSAVKYGRLTAYRYDGERTLRNDKFVWVKVENDPDF
jgi:hypothetical protein